MKKFKYRLNSYLKFLNMKRDNAQKELSRAEAYKNSLIKKYHWMENEMKKSFENNSQFGKNNMNIHLVEDNNQFIQLLKTQMQDLSGQIALAERAFAEKHKKLIDLQVEVKKIEHNKEMKELEHKTELKKKLQKQMDNINAIRLGRL